MESNCDESISDNLDFITFILKNGGKVDKLIASNYTDFSDMFYRCTSLIELSWPSEFSKYIPTDMRFMFSGCTSLVSLDLSNLNTSSITGIGTIGAIDKCTSLIILSVGNWHHSIIRGLTDWNQSFQYLLVSSKIRNQYSVQQYGYTWNDRSITKHLLSKYKRRSVIFTDSMNHYNFITFIIKNGGQTTRLIASDYTDFSEMFKNCNDIVEFTWPSELSSYKPTSLREMFQGCTSLTNLNLTGLDTSSVTDMSEMFHRCTSLTNLNLTGLDTSSVTDMTSMFSECTSLTNLDLTGLDTQLVLNMSWMFSECSSLNELTLSNLNTGSVTNMISMFMKCSSLTNLNLTGLDTSSVTDMNSMFSGCKSLTNLDLTGLDTSSVTDMIEMFCNCCSLVSLDLSNLNTQSVTDISNMFSGCTSLVNLDISGFDVQSVTNMLGMFQGICPITTLAFNNLEDLDWDIIFTTEIRYRSKDCTSLESILVNDDFKNRYGQLVGEDKYWKIMSQ